MGGGFRGPGGGHGGAGNFGGGFHGGSGFGFNRGFVGNFGFRNVARGPFFYNSFGYGYPGWGLGLGLGYTSWPYSYYSYPYSYPGYSYPGYGYEQGSNVTVVYPQAAAPAPVSVYVERATPVMHEYDSAGVEIKPSSPVYLIAFKDGTIRAASSYHVEGTALYYVTLDREEKRVGLDTVDRSFSMQLNRERHVTFQLAQ